MVLIKVCDKISFVKVGRIKKFVNVLPGNTKGESITVLLTSGLTGLESALYNFCFYLQNRLIQTSQTEGQWYSDTSPFSIPWCRIYIILLVRAVLHCKSKILTFPINFRLGMKWLASCKHSSLLGDVVNWTKKDL
jgi:hypothetical protein